MPKNIWKTKRRKKSRKDRTVDFAQDAEIIERSRMPDPNDPTISIGMLSDLSLNIPLKNEVIYPDTRFQSSTTLFPSEGIEEKYLPSETSSQAFERSAQDQLISTMLKKRKMDDLPKTKSTNSDDCEIVENPKKRVKIEVVDLTDDSPSIVSLLCSPVKVSFLGNRLPGKLSTDLQANGDVSVKVESMGNTSASAVGSAGMNYHAIQANSEQNNTSERNDKVNTDNSYVAVNSNADLLGENISRIQVKTEKIVSNESVHSNESSIKHSSANRIKIKTEKGIPRENYTEVNLENSHVAVSKDTDSTAHNIPLRSEVYKENVDIRGSAGNPSHIQEKTVNIVPSESVNSNETFIKHSSSNRIKIKTEKGTSIEKNTEANLGNNHIAANKTADSTTHNISLRSELEKENVNSRGNNVTIKVEQKENCVVDDNSVSLLNFPSDENRDCIYPVDRPIKSEQNKTNESCEVSNNYTQVPKSVTQVKSEPKIMEFQDAYSCEKPQNNEEMSQKISNSNNRNTGVESSKTSIRNELNPTSISHIANSGVFSGDKQIYKPGTIRTPLLKYFNCNKKVEASEISVALSALKNLMNSDGSFDYNEQNETSNSTQVEEKRNTNKILSNDFLHQILSNFKSPNSNGITDVGSSLKKAVDTVTMPSLSINDHSLSQIRKNKFVPSVNCTTDVNKRNSVRTIKNSENFSSLSAPPCNILKRSSSVLTYPGITYLEAFETPPKMVKISDHVSKGYSENGYTHNLPDHLGNHLVNVSSSRDPRLARTHSQAMQVVNSRKPLNSLNINQIFNEPNAKYP